MMFRVVVVVVVVVVTFVVAYFIFVASISTMLSADVWQTLLYLVALHLFTLLTSQACREALTLSRRCLKCSRKSERIRAVLPSLHFSINHRHHENRTRELTNSLSFPHYFLLM